MPGPAQKLPHPRLPPPEPEWPGLLLGWIFIIVVLFGLVFLILQAKPERKMVCDTSSRMVSLTRFGSCRRE